MNLQKNLLVEFKSKKKDLFDKIDLKYELYPNNLKNRILPASDLPHIFRPHFGSCLSTRPLASPPQRTKRPSGTPGPDKKSEEPPCQISDFSSCLGIEEALRRKVDIVSYKYIHPLLKERILLEAIDVLSQ